MRSKFVPVAGKTESANSTILYVIELFSFPCSSAFQNHQVADFLSFEAALFGRITPACPFRALDFTPRLVILE